MSILIAALMLFVQPQPDANARLWHGADGVAAYGVPETDDRLIGLGCASPDELRLFLPSDGGTSRVLINGEGHDGEIAEAGDGLNVILLLSTDSAPVRAMLADGPLTIEADREWTVPGGGAEIVSELIQSCAADEG